MPKRSREMHEAKAVWLLRETGWANETTLSFLDACDLRAFAGIVCSGASTRSEDHILRGCLRGSLWRAASACSRHHRTGIRLEPSCTVQYGCRGSHATHAEHGRNVRGPQPICRFGKPQRRDSVSCGFVERVSWRYAACRGGVLLRLPAHSSTRSFVQQSRCCGV